MSALIEENEATVDYRKRLRGEGAALQAPWGRARAAISRPPGPPLPGGAASLRLGRDMAASLVLRLSLLPLLLALLPGPAGAVWPQPQAQSSPPGGGRCPVPARRFRFATADGSAVGPGCAVLDAAFQRYWPLLFGRPTGEGRGRR